MDKRRTILASAIAMLVVLGYLGLNAYVRSKYPQYFEPLPQDVATNNPPAAVAPPATSPATAQAVPNAGPTTAIAGAATSPAAPTLTAGLQLINPPAAPEGAELGSATRDDPTWPMLLRVSPLGAGLNEVILNGYFHAADYRKPEKDRRPYIFQEPYPEYPDTHPLATRWVEVNGTRIDTAWAAWTKEKEQSAAESQSVTYSLTIGRPATGGGNSQPVLKLLKTYTIYPRRAQGQGFEITVDYRLENLTESPLIVKSGFYGPTMPPRESTRPPDRQVMAGFNTGTRDVIVEGHAIEAFTTDKSTYDLTKNEEGQPAIWFGPASVYFNAFVRPEHPQYVTNVLATGMHLHDANDRTYRPEERPVVTTFETVTTVSPGWPAAVPLNVYFGPRDRKVLRSEYYAAFPREYNDSLVLKVGPCSFCTWLWLIDGLVAMLAAFQWLMGGFAGRGDWGLAIILLVGVVRLCLHPITKRSQVQMMKMGKFGPEIEKLKKKYGDDKEALNKAMIGFYREHGFGLGPILGCLPMFLQMPIWIALYSALQTTFELRQEPFLWGFTWIKDLSKPDYLIKFSQPFTLFFEFLTFDGLNILPILMGVVFWFNHKYTPKPAAMTPEQEQQQKMMQWMTLLFPVFLYNGPSGLNLYILTSTFIGIIEAKVIRKHIKEREEAEKSGKVIVDAGRPTRAARRRKEGEAEPPKKSGIMGWLAELQQKVEQARGEHQDRGGKRKA